MSLSSPSPSPPPSSSLRSEVQQAHSLNDYHQLVKLCIRTGDLDNGQRLHLRLLRSKIPIKPSLSNLFLFLYSKCNRPDLARQVFDRMPQRDIASWTTVISCFAQNNDPAQSIALFLDLLLNDSGPPPNKFTISSVMSACIALGSLQLGQQLHSLAIKNGFSSYVAVGNSIANMYATCGRMGGGSLADSRKVFDRMVERSVVTWSLMITRCVENGLARDAMDLFKQMRIEGFELNDFTITGVMSACTALGSFQLGQQLHSLAIRNGLASIVSVGNSIANIYATCGRTGGGSLADSRKVFDMMVERNVVTWTLMITNYVKNGLANDAMDLFEQMRIEGFEPNEITIAQVMLACIALRSLQLGRQLHSLVIKNGFTSDVAVGSNTANMYAMCGSLADSRKVFDRMVERDAVT